MFEYPFLLFCRWLAGADPFSLALGDDNGRLRCRPRINYILSIPMLLCLAGATHGVSF